MTVLHAERLFGKMEPTIEWAGRRVNVPGPGRHLLGGADMAQRTCSVDGCESQVLARDMCSRHYQAFRKSHPDELKVRRTGCAVEGCEGKHASKGFCGPHYRRFRRWGDPLGSDPRSGECAVDDCTRRAHARGWCSMHYKRWAATGSVDLRPPLSLAERFWSKVDRRGADECWSWTASTFRHGYGKFQLGRDDEHPDGRVAYAPRVAWELANGRAIPDGKVVRHHCDNPPCCNPAHLAVGTQAENTSDMVRRGRGWWQRRSAT